MNQYLLLLTSIPFTPAFAAADTPPERKLSILQILLSLCSLLSRWQGKVLSLLYMTVKLFLSQYPVLMIFMTSY